MYVLTQRAAHLVVCDMVLDQSGQDGTNKRPNGPPRATNGESSRVPAVGDRIFRGAFSPAYRQSLVK